MAEFKKSKLLERMEQYGNLSQTALDFIDACTDDWYVDEYQSTDNEPIDYEIRYTMYGVFHDTDVAVTHTHYGNFDGMCAVVEYLAYQNTLQLRDCGLGVDF